MLNCLQTTHRASMIAESCSEVLLLQVVGRDVKFQAKILLGGKSQVSQKLLKLEKAFS